MTSFFRDLGHFKGCEFSQRLGNGAPCNSPYLPSSSIHPTAPSTSANRAFQSLQAWHKRSIAHFAQQKYREAVEDCEEVDAVVRLAPSGLWAGAFFAGRAGLLERAHRSFRTERGGSTRSHLLRGRKMPGNMC